MQPPAVKIVLQNILNSKNPSSEFPQPVLQVTNASLVYSGNNNVDHQLKDYTTTTATTPAQTQNEPEEAKDKSAAKLRLSDTAHWTHALLQDKDLHDLVSSNKLCKGHIVRLTNYEVIKQARQPKAEDGDEAWSSPPGKRRCRSPVGNGFNVVRPTFGSGETELPCLLIRGLVILSPGKRKEREDEEVKKEMVKSEVKIPIVPPPAIVLKPLPQRAVSGVLSPSRFLSQKKASNNRDPDLTSSSATDHVPTIPGIPRNSSISWADRRMTFGGLETATHGTRASFLAVLLCRRHPYDNKSLDGSKQDWYLWDPTSKLLPPSPSTTTPPHLPHRRRKTILSVWRDHSKFQPTPGTILALRNLTIDKHWNDTLADQNWREILDDKHWDERIGPPVKMAKVGRATGHGNINAFPTTPAEWFLLDAGGVEGYRSVKEWWEGVGRREWESEVRADERLKREIGARREIMRRERDAVLARQGTGGGGEGLKRKREAEEDYSGMDDLETERLMMEELRRDGNFGNG
ncbi:unnamed protein product [Tuber aestivum]|uniref:Uncharacterized protein n=1 Tax=Tuber aestivum TaxID=59557 RepID=A0A292PX30_9PEZI|nr:unnamed protein product [Tuber aestivum]